MNSRIVLVLICILALAAVSVMAEQQKIAVLDFRNETDLSKFELRGLADKVREAALETVSSSRYSIITRENILEMLPPDRNIEDCLGAQCEVEAGRLVGAHIVVSGEVGYFGNQLQVNLKIHETVRGSLLVAETVQAGNITSLAEDLKTQASLSFVEITADRRIREREFGEESEDWEPSTQEKVVIKFESVPPDAMVEVDGVPLGTTPFSRALPVGAVSVSMKKVNYLSTSKSLFLKKGMDPLLRLELTPNFGWLTVKSDPPGLSVIINGENAGQTPLTSRQYPPDSYKVLVSDPDYFDKGKDIVLARGEHETIDLKLKHRMGGLNVSVTDRKGNDLVGKVYLNDEYLGEAPNSWKVPTGRHELRVVTDLGSSNDVVTIVEKQTTDLPVRVSGVLKGSKGVTSDGPRPYSHGARVTSYVLWGTGGAILAGGAVFHVLANQSYLSYQDSDAKDDQDKYQQETEQNAMIGSVLLGVGGAAVVGGTISYLLSGKKSRTSHLDQEMPAFTVGFAPTTNGGAAGFAQIRF